jgi:hypothetical protein
MDNQNFTTSITVEQSPADVFQAINNPKAWWSEEIIGNTNNINDEWTYSFKDNHRSKLKVIEMVPDKKVVWLVEENYFKSFKNPKEWVGNHIVFEIEEADGKTKLTFTQVGLTPSDECYEACNYGWTGFIQKSLFSLITTGIALPKWYE